MQVSLQAAGTIAPHPPENPQDVAADTRHSVWVSASAGTGKTTVLVRRVSRMLLQGCDPARILCITYTKAAAAEMHERLMARLRGWAATSEADLAAMLAAEGLSPTLAPQAQKLFALLTEHPTGLIIQTIHGFCQSVLQRFPIEAGLPASFTVMEEGESLELWAQARHAQHHAIFAGSAPGPAAAQGWLYNHESQYAVESWLTGQAYRHRARLLTMVQQPLAALKARYRDALDAPSIPDIHAHLAEGLADSKLGIAQFRHYVALLLEHGASTDRQAGIALEAWLRLSPQARADDWQLYRKTFLKKPDHSGEPYTPKSLPRKYATLWPEGEDWFAAQAMQAERLETERQAIILADSGACYATLGADLAQRYETALSQQAALDYDALILRTLGLLQAQDQAWVRYKLDGGFDHILLDEAQDTSPSQWAIIRFLTEGLTERAEGAHSPGPRSPGLRSLFVVGDRKQSIYSFQGADPDNYAAQQGGLAEQHGHHGLGWQTVPFTRNYRSTAPVLELVDRIFAQSAARHGLGDEPVAHQPAREGIAGHVECWPLLASAPEGKSKDEAMAAFLAGTIRQWLDERRMLPAKGRPVEPGDILILLRKRGPYARRILRELQAQGIPTAGLDRLSVHNHLAVRDLLTLADWALLPEDDMALALLLRSPLFELPEETLFALAHGRESQSLWQRLHHAAEQDETLRGHLATLNEILARADWMPLYEFFHWLLHGLGFGMRLFRRLGPEIEELCQEFLAMALEYETRHAPSLQGFTLWMRQQHQDIKRELGSGSGVRIMTVHGAKGLQAPIVILPDTGQRPSGTVESLWLEDCLIANPKRGGMLPALRQAVEAQLARQQAERNRLLYVALTRAEDELYMGGYLFGTEKTPSEKNWFHTIWHGMKGWTAEAPMPPPPEGANWWQEEGGTTPQRRMLASTQHTAMVQPASSPTAALPDLPQWLATGPAADYARSAPAHASAPVPSLLAESPGSPEREQGILLHRLLQLLPALPVHEREQAALNRMGHLAPGDAQHHWNMLRQCLENRDLQWLWSEDGLAEVPITGIVEGTLVESRIDRMWKKDGLIRIVDFKTGAPPAQAPEAYQRQLRQYAVLVSRAWPGHRLELYLLWTEACQLMKVDF
jgi:ATP-dependent helicase/nuclease subunit A